MNDRNDETMLELAEKYPDKIDFYVKMKTNRDIYEEELKRLYNHGLELWYAIALLKFDLTKMTRFREETPTNVDNN